MCREHCRGLWEEEEEEEACEKNEHVLALHGGPSAHRDFSICDYVIRLSADQPVCHLLVLVSHHRYDVLAVSNGELTLFEVCLHCREVKSVSFMIQVCNVYLLGVEPVTNYLFKKRVLEKNML